MLSEQTYYRSTAVAQAIMSQAADIQIDGKWGRFTQSAYEKLNPNVRQQVDSALRSLVPAVTASDLRTYREAQRPKQQAVPSVASKDVMGIRVLIANLASEEGVPAALALKVAKLESNFNPNAVSPTGYKGLFQLGPAALKDVASMAKYTVDNVMDPVQNTRAGLKYLKIVARYMNVPLSEFGVVYMAYNIGAGSAKKVLAGRADLAAAQIRHQPKYARNGVDKYYATLQEELAKA